MSEIEDRRAREHAEMVARNAARPLPIDQDPAIRTDSGEVILDPDAAFAGATAPQSAEELAAFNALPPAKPQPFSRDGRDYYVDPGGKLHSVVAGFDAAAAYPGLKPATAQQVAERDLQKQRGGGWDQFDTAIETGAASVAQAASGLVRSWTGPDEGALRPEQVAPFAYTDAALQRRRANPKSAVAGAVGADLAMAALTRRLGGGSAAQNLVGGALGAGTEAELTGEPFSVSNAGLYGLTGAVLEGVGSIAWGEAMRALGKKTSAVDNALVSAQRGAMDAAGRETDAAARAAALRENAAEFYAQHQTALDGALETIDEKLVSAPDKLFTPGRLKRTVSENLAGQAANLQTLSQKLNAAAEVTGSLAARQAAGALAAADQSGAGLYAALQQAGRALSAGGESSPLVTEAMAAIEDSLRDESLWGRAAKNYRTLAELPPAGGGGPMRVEDIATRPELDAFLERARTVASTTDDKALLSAIRKAEQAIVDADAVTGARLMGPELPGAEPPLTLGQKIAKRAASRAMTSVVGKVAGGIGGGLIGGPAGAIGGTILGDVAGHFAAPHIERLANRLAGIGQRHGGKIAAAGLIGAGGALAASDEEQPGIAAAGAGILALPILLRGGAKMGLVEALREYELGLSKAGAKSTGPGRFYWTDKEPILEELTGNASSSRARLIERASEALAERGVPLHAPARDIEEVLAADPYFERNFSGARKDYQSEARAATRAANKGKAPALVSARAALGNVGAGLEEPFVGRWFRPTANYFKGGSAEYFAREGDAIGDVLKARLKDKAPLTWDEVVDNLGKGLRENRRTWNGEGLPEGMQKLDFTESMKLGREGGQAYREAADTAARAFHAETARKISEEQFAGLRQRVDRALEGIDEGDRVARVSAEDQAIRATLREALGMKPAKVQRDLATHVDAESRYRKNKKGFDGWAKTALDEEQQKALRDWQSHEYRVINADAREGEAAAEDAARGVAKMYLKRGFIKADELVQETGRLMSKAPQTGAALLDAMNHAIEQGHTVPGVVKRGISMPAEELARLKNAQTVTSQGFMSTSIHKSTPEAFAARRADQLDEVPVMLSIEQKTGVPIGQGEGEITLRPGTKFSVEFVEPPDETGVVHAYLKEVEPSKLTPADILKGIAGSIPTEAKVAAGLLAVDAATSDDHEPGKFTAAGVGALALLFGGPRRMRGITSRLAVTGAKLGEVAPQLERILTENEKTINSVARWGETAERQPLQRAVENLKDIIERRALDDDGVRAAVRGALDEGNGFREGLARDYLEAAVEKRLAQAAGSAIGQRSAAPQVQAIIEGQTEIPGRLDKHALMTVFPPADSERLTQKMAQAREALLDKGGPGSRIAVREAADNIDAVARHAGTLAAERLISRHEPSPAAIHDQLAKVESDTLDRYAQAYRPGRGLPLELLPEEERLLHVSLMQAVDERWQAARSAAALEAQRAPARGLQVRAALKGLVESPDDVEGLLVETGNAVEDAQYRAQVERDLIKRLHTQWDLPDPVARAVAGDVVDAVKSGRPLEGAVDDIAHTLDSSAANLPLTEVEHRKAKRAFELWEMGASDKAGFSIRNAIDDYAGDWDYKNINAYARGQLDGVPQPSKAQIREVLRQAGRDGNDELFQAAKDALDGDEDAIGVISDHIVHTLGEELLGKKQLPVPNGSKQAQQASMTEKAEAFDEWANGPDGDADFEGVAKDAMAGDEGAQNTVESWWATQGPKEAAPSEVSKDVQRAQEKAERLQHALDLAVSDGYTAPGVTYRGAVMSEADLQRLAESPQAEAHAFMSTTANADYAWRFINRKELLRKNPDLRPVLFEVHQKTGVPWNESEDEVLLRAGTRFRLEPIDSPSEVLGQMNDHTKQQVKFRLVETDEEPKLPTTLNSKSALPWVAGGVLSLGAGKALEGDANAAEVDPEHPLGALLPANDVDPARELEKDATRQKLQYLQAQSKVLITSTARALVGPAPVQTAPVVPGLTHSAGVAKFVGNQDSLRAAYDHKRSTLQRLQTDPMSLVDELSSQLGDVSDAAPEVHQQIVAKTYEIVRFLQEKLPGTIGACLMRPEGTPPSDFALRQFALYYSAATDPSTVLRDLGNNRARKEQVATLQQIWPEVYQNLKVALVDQVSQGRRPSFNQRVRLDLLFDFNEALDRSLSPRLVKALAEHRAQQPTKPDGSTMPTRRSNPSIVGTSPAPQLSMAAGASLA